MASLTEAAAAALEAAATAVAAAATAGNEAEAAAALVDLVLMLLVGEMLELLVRCLIFCMRRAWS